ncbi:unnamed protein product [Amoebophrya sp. A25]|nr:unnamed protein product [Amoebophrya sp. A25]|eukprot:GSA25T00014905001.1
MAWLLVHLHLCNDVEDASPCHSRPTPLVLFKIAGAHKLTPERSMSIFHYALFQRQVPTSSIKSWPSHPVSYLALFFILDLTSFIPDNAMGMVELPSLSLFDREVCLRWS